MATLDIKIQNTCDHRIQGDSTRLGFDGITIEPNYFLASELSLRISRFGVVLPRSGYRILDTVENAELNTRTRNIELIHRDKYRNTDYELDYVTTRETCPKCGGTDYTDDVTPRQDGDLRSVQDEALLAQSAEKHVITELQSNPYHPWVGTKLHSLIGLKSVDLNLIDTQIREEITQSINKMKEVMYQHAAANPEVSEEEQLDDITDITIKQQEQDPSVFEVRVTYRALSGKTLELIQLFDLSAFRLR